MEWSGNASSEMQVHRLTKTNYDNWKIQMRVLLGANDAWSVVESGVTSADDAGTSTATQAKVMEKNRQKDQLALYLLYRALDEAGFENISEAKDAKEAWRKLTREPTM